MNNITNKTSENKKVVAMKLKYRDMFNTALSLADDIGYTGPLFYKKDKNGNKIEYKLCILNQYHK